MQTAIVAYALHAPKNLVWMLVKWWKNLNSSKVPKQGTQQFLLVC